MFFDESEEATPVNGKERDEEAPWCPYCNGTATLTTGAVMIPHAPARAGERLWACVPCDAYVRCHRDSDRPLGLPARSELRMARRHVHERHLDPLWRDAHLGERYANRRLDATAVRNIGRRARDRVYAWLAEQMDVSEEEAHVGMFDLEDCARAGELLASTTYEAIRAWARPIEEARWLVRQHERRVARDARFAEVDEGRRLAA